MALSACQRVSGDRRRFRKLSIYVKKARIVEIQALLDDPYGTRTRVTAVKGRCPRPLDEGAPVRFESDRSITVERVLPNF